MRINTGITSPKIGRVLVGVELALPAGYRQSTLFGLEVYKLEHLTWRLPIMAHIPLPWQLPYLRGGIRGGGGWYWTRWGETEFVKGGPGACTNIVGGACSAPTPDSTVTIHPNVWSSEFMLRVGLVAEILPAGDAWVIQLTSNYTWQEDASQMIDFTLGIAGFLE